MNDLSNQQRKVKSQLLNSFLFKLFLIMKLPLAFIAGMRVKRLNEELAQVKIPFGYWTKNPFQSMYFAAQNIGAEFSTAALLLLSLKKHKREFSMLVIDMEADFYKKAKGDVLFVCKGVKDLNELIEIALSTGEGQLVKLVSTGELEDGTVVSSFSFTWSIKVKNK